MGSIANSFGGGRRPPSPPSILIRVVHGAPGVDLEVQGQYSLMIQIWITINVNAISILAFVESVVISSNWRRAKVGGRVS